MKNILLMTSIVILASCTIIMPPVDPNAQTTLQPAVNSQPARKQAQNRQAVSNTDTRIQTEIAPAPLKTSTTQAKSEKVKTDKTTLKNCIKPKKDKVKKSDDKSSNTAKTAATADNTGKKQSSESRNKIKPVNSEATGKDDEKVKEKKKRKPCTEFTDKEIQIEE